MLNQSDNFIIFNFLRIIRYGSVVSWCKIIISRLKKNLILSALPLNRGITLVKLFIKLFKI